jgi:hypothetical protein
VVGGCASNASISLVVIADAVSAWVIQGRRRQMRMRATNETIQ